METTPKATTPQTTPKAATPQNTPKACSPMVKMESKSNDEDLTMEEKLKSEVKGVIGDLSIMKTLCLSLFSEEEVANSTRTGKTTLKAKANVKPPLDQTKFDIFENLTVQLTSFDKSTFHKKFENLQKVLRRNLKKKT